MADLFHVTAPLLVRCPGHGARVSLRAYPHPDGMVCLGLYGRGQSVPDALFRVSGAIRGEGPWKVGDCVVTVLGCHGTDPRPAGDYAAWRQDVESGEIPSLPEPEVLQCARRLGALV